MDLVTRVLPRQIVFKIVNDTSFVVFFVRTKKGMVLRNTGMFRKDINPFLIKPTEHTFNPIMLWTISIKPFSGK